MKKIVVMGANAARQKTLKFDRFICGEVNRARSIDVCAAGKGINFCRAAGICGKVKSVLIEFTGGENGSFVKDFLKAEGIDAINIDTANPTRCCVTCLDMLDQVMTEVIEPSFPVSASEADAFIQAFSASLAGASGAAICGSLPDGSDPALYLKAGRAALDAGVPLLLDAYKNLEPLLQQGGNMIIKINRSELASLTGVDGVAAGLERLFNSFAISGAAITDGAGAAYASDGKKLVTYTLPELAGVVNPIGCGDTASAVLMSEICCGMDIFEAFRYALGAASANVLTITPGVFDPATADTITGKISVTETVLNRSI